MEIKSKTALTIHIKATFTTCWQDFFKQCLNNNGDKKCRRCAFFYKTSAKCQKFNQYECKTCDILVF